MSHQKNDVERLQPTQYTWKNTTLVVNKTNNINIGKRTGKDVKKGKNIRTNENGYEVFDDYWSDESESSVASSIIASESTRRIHTEKENVPGSEVRTASVIAFKAPAKPTSASDDIDMSQASKTFPSTSNTSDFQKSSTTLNGAGDAHGSISRSQLSASAQSQQPPKEVEKGLENTRKRLTYSAAFTAEGNLLPEAANCEVETDSGEPPQEVNADTETWGESTADAEKHKTATETEKSVEGELQAADQSVHSKEGHPESNTDNAKENNTVEETGGMLRRSKRHGTRGKQDGVLTDSQERKKKLQKASKNKPEKRKSAERDIDGDNEDVYSFESEDVTPKKKPRKEPKKNLQEAFDASTSKKDHVGRSGTDNEVVASDEEVVLNVGTSDGQNSQITHNIESENLEQQVQELEKESEPVAADAAASEQMEFGGRVEEENERIDTQTSSKIATSAPRQQPSTSASEKQDRIASDGEAEFISIGRKFPGAEDPKTYSDGEDDDYEMVDSPIQSPVQKNKSSSNWRTSTSSNNQIRVKKKSLSKKLSKNDKKSTDNKNILKPRRTSLKDTMSQSQRKKLPKAGGGKGSSSKKENSEKPSSKKSSQNVLAKSSEPALSQVDHADSDDDTYQRQHVTQTEVGSQDELSSNSKTIRTKRRKRTPVTFQNRQRSRSKNKEKQRASFAAEVDSNKRKENVETPKDVFRVPSVGSSSKPVIRRSRSSLTVVSRNRTTATASAQPSTSTGIGARQSQKIAKSAKAYNKYTDLLGDFEEELDTSSANSVTKSFRQSVSRATTTGKQSGAGEEHGDSQTDLEDEAGGFGASPDLQKTKKRRSRLPKVLHPDEEITNKKSTQSTLEEDNDTPLVKKKRTNGKKNRISSGSQSRDVLQHRRVNQLQDSADRRGSIITSTPLVPGRKRKSVGFAVTPSPKPSGSIECTPRSVLKKSTALPKYSVASPLHDQDTSDTVGPTPEKTPKQKTVKIVLPDVPENSKLRRSKRSRVKPLAWFVGERIRYDRRKSGSVVAGVINPVEENNCLPEFFDAVNHNRKNPKKRVKKVQKVRQFGTPRNLSIHRVLPSDCESGLDSSVIPVLGAHEEEEYAECVRTKDDYRFVGPTQKEPVPSDPFVLSQFLSHKAFSMGQLIIRPLENKELQLSLSMMVFYVVYGKLAVEIHRTKRSLQSGDSFFVPPGNTYFIQNLRNDEAKLLFTQIK